MPCTCHIYRTRERKLTERVQENVKLSREVSEKWQEEIMKEHQKVIDTLSVSADITSFMFPSAWKRQTC